MAIPLPSPAGVGILRHWQRNIPCGSAALANQFDVIPIRGGDEGNNGSTGVYRAILSDELATLLVDASQAAYMSSTSMGDVTVGISRPPPANNAWLSLWGCWCR